MVIRLKPIKLRQSNTRRIGKNVWINTRFCKFIISTHHFPKPVNCQEKTHDTATENSFCFTICT